MSSLSHDGEMDAMGGRRESLAIGSRDVDEGPRSSPSKSSSLLAQPSSQVEEAESLHGNNEDEDKNEEDSPAWMVNVPTLTLHPRPKRGRLAPSDSAPIEDSMSRPLPSSLFVPFIDETIAKAKRMKTMPPRIIPNDRDYEKDDVETRIKAPRARTVSSGSVSLAHPSEAAAVATPMEASPFKDIQSHHDPPRFSLRSDAFSLDKDDEAHVSSPKSLQPRKIQRHFQHPVPTVSKPNVVRVLFAKETHMEETKTIVNTHTTESNTSTGTDSMPLSSMISAFSRPY